VTAAEGAVDGTDSVDPVDALVLDLLEWIGPSARSYDEVMEAWRTSCPRLPVWETANERGLVERCSAPGRGSLVSMSAAGSEHLRTQRSDTLD
jgi:D-3-phosphoglycerate dehydrogenase / 2-oxoglutarate reductase